MLKVRTLSLVRHLSKLYDREIIIKEKSVGESRRAGHWVPSNGMIVILSLWYDGEEKGGPQR